MMISYLVSSKNSPYYTLFGVTFFLYTAILIVKNDDTNRIIVLAVYLEGKLINAIKL